MPEKGEIKIEFLYNKSEIGLECKISNISVLTENVGIIKDEDLAMVGMDIMKLAIALMRREAEAEVGKEVPLNK